jgi:hypothetical protein
VCQPSTVRTTQIAPILFPDPIKSHATLVVGEVDRAATDPSVGGAQLDRVVLNFIDLFKSSPSHVPHRIWP